MGLNYYKEFNKYKIQVAIDIRDKYVVIAATETKKEGSTLLLLQEVNYPEGIKQDKSKFNKWMKRLCNKLKKEFKTPFFWLLMSSQKVKTFYLTIPRVDKKDRDQIVYYALKKESKLDLRKYNYDYTTLKGKGVKGEQKLNVFAYVVEKQEIEKFKKIIHELDINPAGITSYNLALSNLFYGSEDNVAHVFLGTDWSRIDIYNNGFLIFSRDIKTGFVSIANELYENLDIEQRAIFFKNNVQNDIYKKGTTFLEEIKEFFTKLGDRDNKYIESNKISEAISSSLQRLILQLTRTFQFYSSNMGKGEVTKLYLSGVTELPDFVLENIKTSIGISVDRLTPIKNKMIKTVKELNLLSFKEADYAPVIACTIPCEYTFNFLLNSKDVKKMKLKRNISISVSILFIFFSIMLFGYYIKLNTEFKKEKKEYLYYKKRLSNISTLIDENYLLNLTNKLNLKIDGLKNSLKLIKPIMVLKSISHITPDYIKWTDVEMDNDLRKLKLAVVITNNKDIQLKMAKYLLNLRNLPFITEVMLEGEQQKYINEKLVNSFFVEIKIK